MTHILVYLIFCSSVRETVCTIPKEMPNAKVCHFVGRNMVELATGGRAAIDGAPWARYRCLTIR